MNNINNQTEGKANTSIRDPKVNYRYNPDINTDYRGYPLTLACQSGTDMMHSVGNVTAVIQQFIVDQFPSETFNTVMSATRLAHNQLRQTPKQLKTQSYPMCIVKPRVSLSGLDSRFGAGSFATSNWSNTSSRFQNRSEMLNMMFDRQKGIGWLGKINRIVMQFDFVLSFKSVAEQLRWASYLINKMPTDSNRPFDIDTNLELALPDGFLMETSRYCGIPVKDENGSVARFVDYLNMYSAYPITYRFSSGKHMDAFYANYEASLFCNITDISYNSTSRVGQIELDCPITFTLRCEFNTIGMFDLCVPNPGEFKIVTPDMSHTFIPIFSDSFNENDFPLNYGWKILCKPIVKLDWDEKEVDISSVFSDTLLEMIDFHINNNMRTDVFINVNLRENHDLIHDGYYVDWKNRKLVFTTANYHSTYRIIITINQLYLNNLMVDMYNK